MNSIIAVLDTYTVLILGVILLCLFLLVAITFIAVQQLYIRYLHAQQIDLVRETTAALSQVTATIPNITRTIEATADIVPQVKTEIISCLNQMETRLTNTIDRITQKTTVNNTFTPIDRVDGHSVHLGDRNVG